MVKKVTIAKIISLYLNDYGRRYYLRELASLLGKPHQTIKSYVDSLTKEGILIKTERKNITEYSLNFHNKGIYDYLTIAEKEGLMERLGRDILFKVLFEKLSPLFKNNTFIIFGSAVNGVKKGSDIDILIISNKQIFKEMDNFESIYNKRIHKIIIKNIEKLTLPLTQEVYKKHLIFNNTEQVIRYFTELYEQNKLV